MKNLKILLGLAVCLITLHSTAWAQMYKTTTFGFAATTFVQSQAKEQLLKTLNTSISELNIVINYNQDKSIIIWEEPDGNYTSSITNDTLTKNAIIEVIINYVSVNFADITAQYFNWYVAKSKEVHVFDAVDWLQLVREAYDSDTECATIRIYSDTTYLCTVIYDKEYLWSAEIDAEKDPWGRIQIQSPSHYLIKQLYIKSSLRD